MERVSATMWEDRDRDRDLAGVRKSVGFALPSRAAAIGTFRADLEARGGPVLVTGEAGVGKTWLCRQVRDAMPVPWRWAVVDLSPSSTPADLYRMIGHALGLANPDGLSASRLDLEDYLLESSADGDRWVLVLDEAHGASPSVLEEIRILANRLSRPDGFAGVVLVGQTALARRLASRPLAAVGSRLSARVHLRPLDIEEARRLIDHLAPGSVRDDSAFERLHRDARGNPRRLILQTRPAPVPVPISRPLAPERIAPPTPSDHAPIVAPRREPAWEEPLAGPSRPPLRVEEGLIEVGWEPPRSPAPVPAEAAATTTSAVSVVDEAEKPIIDHYAALQAWNEWARNQGRAPGANTLDPALAPRERLDESAEEEEEGESVPSRSDSSDVWIEGEHGFSPYSQLFSKLRTTK